jgi:hypothetical protein
LAPTRKKPEVAGDFIPRVHDDGNGDVSADRGLIIGQTGSGKTVYTKWLLKRIPESPTVIYDTKGEAKFNTLPNSRIVSSISAVEEALDDVSLDYIILRPPTWMTADHRTMDRMLVHHELYWHKVAAYIDELYQFHAHGRAGPGITGLWTRGRSKGIIAIGSTQRPAYISPFVFSESSLFYVFWLSVEDDRKRVKNFIPGFADLPNAPKPQFYVYRQGSDEAPKLMPPVPMDEDAKKGYRADVEGEADPDSDLDRPAKSGIVWL